MSTTHPYNPEYSQLPAMATMPSAATEPSYGYYRPTDGFSITSMILGLTGFHILAIILGMIGLSRTKNGTRGGRGFAIAGIILGSLWLFAILLSFLVLGAIALLV